ncbi:uncharacterized protein LOC129741548 [Uranotaenia lowii]|uniref:uncharacterized protein LOC129741548 n=1 Tax=Uranotaenia lowii TaxID=190385 RepID=UPI00247907B4|nr:uncharacterized protein LOC129741548 [Uranotaenia lowii]
MDFEQQWLVLAQAAIRKQSRSRGGSQPGKRPNINRQAQDGAKRLMADYFSESSVYTDEQFRRRFRMGRKLFLEVANKVEQNNKYFAQKPDATGKWGLTCLQKCTAALRQLAYGAPLDAIDEYGRLAESTARKCLMEFCRSVIQVFMEKYLRSPTRSDIERLLHKGQERGFPGMAVQREREKADDHSGNCSIL